MAPAYCSSNTLQPVSYTHLAYTNALFEVVVHDFTKEEALHYLDTMHQFFIPGWRAILGL